MKNKLRQLTPQEVLFIGGETDTVYQHTAGLTLLDASDRPDFGFESFRRAFEAKMSNIPPMRWKLHEVPLGLDMPYWVEDRNFSFDNHIRRIAVPSPGDEKALGELVSYLYSRHMDRNRPLWETWFIEGLADGQYALLQKMHHCLMDGEGAARMGAAISDLEPDAKPRKIDPDIAEAEAGEIPERWRESVVAARHLSSFPYRVGREAYGMLRDGVRQRLKGGSSRGLKVRLPLVRFNGEIGRERGFVFGTLSLADIKAVKNHYHVTVNDVILALVSRSLRAYLQRRNELPRQSLRSFMAVSLRTEGDDSFSNRVTSVSTTLATNRRDPVNTLKAISAETTEVKRLAHTGNRGIMEAMEILPPFLLNVMFRVLPGDIIAEQSGANLLVSNVRGSPWPFYLAGARQTAMYPMSILMSGAGINVTCVSYVDYVNFGVTLDPALFPDGWEFIDGLKQALDEYVALTKTPSARRQKSAARKPAARAGQATRSAAKRTPARTVQRTPANKAQRTTAKATGRTPAKAAPKAATPRRSRGKVDAPVRPKLASGGSAETAEKSAPAVEPASPRPLADS